jgi:hypothetical protein
LTPLNPSPQRRSNTSKTLLIPSYTICKHLTQNFLIYSVPLQYAKAMAQRQWLMHVTNSSTTLLHIPMQAFGPKHVTWYYQYTQTCHTFPNPPVKVEKPIISSYPIAMTKTSTIVPFSPFLQSSQNGAILSVILIEIAPDLKMF